MLAVFFPRVQESQLYFIMDKSLFVALIPVALTFIVKNAASHVFSYIVKHQSWLVVELQVSYFILWNIFLHRLRITLITASKACFLTVHVGFWLLLQDLIK